MRQVVLWLVQVCFVARRWPAWRAVRRTGTAGASDAGTRHRHRIGCDAGPQARANPAGAGGRIISTGARPTIALDELKRALATDPTYAEAYNLRGLVYMRLDDPELAEDSFRRAMALKPRDGDILHNYGWLLCQQTPLPGGRPGFQAGAGHPALWRTGQDADDAGLVPDAGRPQGARRKPAVPVLRTGCRQSRSPATTWPV